MTSPTSLPYTSVKTHPFNDWQIQSIATSQENSYSVVTACFHTIFQKISSQQLHALETLNIEKITYCLRESAITLFFTLTQERDQFFDKIRCFVQMATEEDISILKRQNSPLSNWEIIDYEENEKKTNEITLTFKNTEKRNEIFYDLDQLLTFGMDTLSLIPRSNQILFKFTSPQEKDAFKNEVKQQALMTL